MSTLAADCRSAISIQTRRQCMLDISCSTLSVDAFLASNALNLDFISFQFTTSSSTVYIVHTIPFFILFLIFRLFLFSLLGAVGLTCSIALFFAEDSTIFIHNSSRFTPYGNARKYTFLGRPLRHNIRRNFYNC